jgi:hypothetical protein
MALLVTLLVIPMACDRGSGNGGPDGTPAPAGLPLVDQITPAVEALERSIGRPVEYYELNADARLVNLFVATDDGATATPYVYLDGELQPPGPPLEVSTGNTFVADDVAFDPDTVLSGVASELDPSTLARFVVLAGPAGDVRYEVLVRSRQGGALSVVVGPDGAVREVVPLS